MSSPIRDDTNMQSHWHTTTPVSAVSRSDLQALDERLFLIESAVQQIDQMMLIMATDDIQAPKILFANARVIAATGYTLAELAEAGPYILHGPEANSALIAQFQQILGDGRPFTGEMLLYPKQGRPFYAEHSLTPLPEQQGHPTRWVIVLHDITARKRAQDVRTQRQKLESLGVLASGIAHDFNNLLAVILGNASIALSDLPADADMRELLIPIDAAARRAAELTRQMMAYAGHDRLTAQSLDLNLAVRAACANLAERFTHIPLDLHLAPDLPAIIADVAQIQRVIHNLLLNAYESINMPGGSILITSELRSVDRDYIASAYLAPNLPAGLYLTLSIEDTGIGMNPELLARAFEPFFSTKFVGRGLGLAEALGVINAHHGAIKIESSPDSGTCCTILLPIPTTPQRDALEPPTPINAIHSATHQLGSGVKPELLGRVRR